MKKPFRNTFVVLLALVLIGGTAIWFKSRGGSSQSAAYETAAVTRGDMLVSISATGTVEPEEVIDVGAQVAGRIVSFGKDADGRTVDYGSHVTEGTVLARIDDSLYAADAANAQAQVQAAQAGLQRSQADLGQYQAKLVQAELDWQRAEKMGPSQAISKTSYDSYRAAYETAKANLAVGQAAILQAKASLAQAQAQAQRAQRNLSYCTITSPVKGVIIDRRVNIGQTVVSSLNAPSLFLIAKDLTRMQVWVAVNEADIGKIHPGQQAVFTVDAFPGRTFKGTVGKVRLNASMTQNVVTYTVEIATDNSDGVLLPYLTANVQFELQRLDNVLRVPNAALRFTPQADQITPQYRDAAARTDQKSGAGGGAAVRESGGSGRPEGGKRRVLWVAEGAYLRPVQVVAGISDGTLTEVRGDGLTQGMQVVTGLKAQGGASGDTRNPFTPQFLRRNNNQGTR